MLHCLDTNIIIDVFRGDDALKEKVTALHPEEICLTPINLAELYKGAYKAHRRQEALALVQELASNVTNLSFNDDACKLFGELHADLQAKGALTSDADLMIGCIALAHNAVLVTRNKKDFVNIHGLKIVEW